MKFTKLLVLGALLLAGSGVAKAVSADVWQKPTLAVPEVTTFTAYQEDVEVYLYNVSSHLFFVSGNDWGTRASLIARLNENAAEYTVKGAPVTFMRTEAAIAKGDGVVELKSLVEKFNQVRSCFSGAVDDIWTDNNDRADRFWTVTANGDSYHISNVDTEPTLCLGWKGSYEDTRLYLLDPAENAGVEWKMVTKEAYDQWLEAVAAANIDYNAYMTAIGIYNAAMELKAVLDEAEALGINVDEYIAVYNNTSSTLEELNAAIEAVKKAIAAGGINTATAENPADATGYIVNPDWAGGNTKGWSQAPSLEKHGDIYTAEFYNQTYDMNQTITGLPEGVYSLNLKGFYREGGYSGAAFEKHLTGKEHLNAYIYITQDNDTVTKPLMSIYKEASETGYGNSTEVTVTAGDKTVYIPNMRESAQMYFNDGRYNVNTAYFNSTGADFMIGLKKTVGVGSDWTPFNDFTLKYYGKGADAYQLWLNELLKEFSELTIPEGTIYTEQYKTAYEEVLASEKTAGNVEEVAAALADVSAAYDALMLNIDLWQKYQELCLKAKDVAANEDYNETARESLADYEMDLYDNINARIMTNEELQALCDEIEAAIDNAIRTPKDGADITDQYLVNAGFDTNDETGWSGRSSITDIAHSAAEAYEKNPFDLYQEVKNAPIGVYEISLQGFFRAGSNNDAWPAYRDAGNKPGVIPAQAWVYLNQKQTELNNCYDVQVLPYSTYDLTEGYNYLAGMVPYGLYDAAGDSIRNADGDVVYVPNNMSQAQDAFMKGYYTKSALGLVAKEGDPLRIGIKGNLGSSCWAIWDNFRLIYRGFKADVVREVLLEEMAKVEAYKNELIGKNVRDIIAEKLAAADAVKDAENGKDMFGALTDLFEVGDTVQASKAIFAELEKSYEKLTAAILEAVAATETIQKATDLQNDIYNNVFAIEPAAVEWTDEKAEATIAEIEQMIKDLATPGDFANATDDDPKDATWYIENPKYAENNNEGWTSEEAPGFGSNLCEMWNKSEFEYYQDLTGLLEGTYELTVQGFYRAGGGYDADFEAFSADPTANNNLRLFVKVGENEATALMPRMCSATEPYTSTKWDTNEDGSPKLDDEGNKTFWSSDDNNWQWVWAGAYTVAEDGESATGQRACNGMATAAEMFSKGHYLGTSITFKPDAEGNARIGLQKIAAIGSDWCIWSNWTLTYYGKNSTKPDATGIAASFSNGQVARTEFYNLNGARISAPQQGVVIMKQTMADGTVKVRKVVVK